MLFEKANLAFKGKEFICSQLAEDICKNIFNHLESQDAAEHRFYKIGKVHIDNMVNFPIIATDNFHFSAAKRFHNLVRLGGDIIVSGLASYSHFTILGGLIVMHNPI